MARHLTNIRPSKGECALPNRTGGAFEGFRLATRSEFDSLYTNAGLPKSSGPISTGANNPSYVAAAQSLINFLGFYTYDYGSGTVSYASGGKVSGTQIFGLLEIDIIGGTGYSWPPGTYYRAESYGVAGFLDTDSSLDSGLWLVTTTTPNPVPIPPTAWLLAAGLVGLVGLRRRFKK